ncbi:hypothetical protein [Sphingomonas sp. Leaf38]|uniref:hypothetical protein n=1 Tax=Sphingomonas sp. Leaf38 TaxID=1736217 RepID=UPI0006FFE135|nr:hypothetical protein [Sphingomonas sp. Leaf38]KQN29371.1 hypothetical protein ASE88_10560 [Sphingomonas sp. Leaf38]
MHATPIPLPSGRYRDVLRAPDGTVTWQSDWRSNVVVTGTRLLLASYMRGSPAALPIGALAIGGGVPTWDATPPPAPTEAEIALADPAPFLVTGPALAMDFLNGDIVSAAPTNRLQIKATIGPAVPPWPDAHHVAANLREFGLMATLGGARLLVNLVRHPVIAKDPVSTLERTIWLLF